MEKKQKALLISSNILLILFVAFTIIVKYVDLGVVAIDNIQQVGLSHINKFFLEKLDISDTWYKITNYLGYFAILCAIGFVILALIQWIKTKSLKKVDKKLYILFVFYAVVILFYILFELVSINYRPRLIGGELEKSYPSSHTMLAICIFGSCIIMLGRLIKNKKVLIICGTLLSLLIAVIVIGRLLSGVHWFTDILGGVILSLGLLLLFNFFINLFSDKKTTISSPEKQSDAEPTKEENK